MKIITSEMCEQTTTDYISTIVYLTLFNLTGPAINGLVAPNELTFDRIFSFW